MAAPMSCTSQAAFCCILHSFASVGKSVGPPTDHGSMSRLMFGLTKATRPPHKMRQRMRQKCVSCCQRRSTVAVFDEFKEHYCTECIDTQHVVC